MTDPTTSTASSDLRARGSIGLSPSAIAGIAGRAAIECYGIVGMASRRPIDGIARVLHLSNLSRGVEVHTVGGAFEVDLYVIVEYGMRISEVAHNVQNQVKYAVERATNLPVRAVNVNVQDLHVAKSR